jgi:hypothetical protein
MTDTMSLSSKGSIPLATLTPELPSVRNGASGAMPADAVTPAAHALLLIVLQAAVFMVAAEARVIAPLLPAMAADFQTTIADAGLLISAYALPYGVFQLVMAHWPIVSAASGSWASPWAYSRWAPSSAVSCPVLAR